MDASSFRPPRDAASKLHEWHRAASTLDTDAEGSGSGNGTGNGDRSVRFRAAARPDEAPVPVPEFQMPKTRHYRAKGSIANTPLAVSLISAVLGGAVVLALVVAATPVLPAIASAAPVWVRPQLGIYLSAIALFHLLEFWITAGWNYQKLSVDAFLLNNTSDYHIAHAVGITEYIISSYLWPSKFETAFASPVALLFSFALMVFGQTFRSLAMVHAAQSFSHIVKRVKLEDHTLVTTGVYSFVRHPSYVGFFYWAIGTQLFMSNVVSTLAFVFVLGRFFSSRIKDEEVLLIRFFGDKYIEYRKKVGTGLFFVK